MIAPVADSAANTPSLFETKEGVSDDLPDSFTLKNVETNEEGAVWLTYMLNNRKTE